MKFARGFAGAACALTAMVAIEQASAQSTYSRSYPPPPPPSRTPPPPNYGDSGGSGWGAAIPIIFGAAIVGAAVASSHQRHNEEHVDGGDLATNGPKLDLTQQAGSLVVHGFVQSGWPLVIDFQPRPGTQTVASISVPGHAPKLVTLDNMSDGRRRVVNDIRIPDGFGSRNPQPGVIMVYSIISYPLRGAPGEPHAPVVVYSPLEIYGIGAGPSAVGSVAIENLQFTQQRRSPGAGFATWGYMAESRFTHVSAEVLRFSSSGATINVASIRQLGLADGYVGHFGPQPWDGLDAHGQKQAGVTRLQVRGWLNTSNDKSWVGAVSPQAIVIK